MNILVTGKDGQLGSEIQALAKNHSGNFIFKSSSECDITDINRIEEVVIENNIEAIINCAAYTAVDKAEDDYEKALLINGTGTENLVRVCEKHSTKLIHISTDYVFSGNGKSPYSIDAKTEPLGIYGSTKRKGEEAILNSESDSIVIRTSWVYSEFGANFVKTMRRLGKERESLNVVADQLGSPTYAADLAEACLQILSKKEQISSKSKIYHYSNTGEISWFDFAKEIFALSDIDCEVSPITTDQFPTRAKRPQYSVLETKNIQEDFSLEIKDWKVSLKRCIDRLDSISD